MSKQTIEVDVPEGFELTSQTVNTLRVLSTDGIIIDADPPYISIELKKSQPIKDFKWYIEEYFKQSQIYDRELAAMYVVDLFQEKYDNVPKEMMLGLIIFICKDFNKNWNNFLNEQLNISALDKLYSIIPLKLIQSILL